MNSKTKEEREEAIERIMEEHIERELKNNCKNGESFVVSIERKLIHEWLSFIYLFETIDSNNKIVFDLFRSKYDKKRSYNLWKGNQWLKE